jgi:hypothetical protein
LKPVLARMTAEVTLHVVEGADHSLNRGRRAQNYDDVLDVVSGWMTVTAERSRRD